MLQTAMGAMLSWLSSTAVHVTEFGTWAGQIDTFSLSST